MLVKGIIDEDVVNYKKTSMFIAFPYCSFKCEKDSGVRCCQNSNLANSPNIEVDAAELVERYMNNPMTHAVVCGGLEPFDSPDDLLEFVRLFREKTNDDIVIYTGYTSYECTKLILELSRYRNIIIKLGRFVPNVPGHFDKLLGVTLQSYNQYAIHTTWEQNTGEKHEN